MNYILYKVNMKKTRNKEKVIVWEYEKEGSWRIDRREKEKD